MTTATLGKWGNASAVRLPKPFCDMLHLQVGDDVRIYVEDDRRIVIESAREKDTLKGRMEAWDGKRYQGRELDWGAPAGEELW